MEREIIKVMRGNTGNDQLSGRAHRSEATNNSGKIKHISQGSKFIAVLGSN